MYICLHFQLRIRKNYTDLKFDSLSISGKISSRLEDRRERMNKLSSVHGLLQKLQFLMDLPTTLKDKIDNGEYGQAVRVYQKAHRVLEAYKDMPSFKGSRRSLPHLK